ncbi:TonB-system energizer ExbB [Methylomagnum sp.]
MNKVWMALILAGLTGPAAAGELDDLVRQVQESQARERQADEARKTHFLADKNQQQKLLADTKAALAKAEADSKSLREQFTANEARIKELNGQIKTQSGELSSLFSAVREFSGKLRTDIENSLVSAQFPGRAEALKSLAVGKALPGIPELEKLWSSALVEMAESGKVVKFPGKVTDAAGVPQQIEVYRIGAFAALANDRYLRYTPAAGLVEPSRQPDSDHLALAKNLRAGQESPVKIAVDPSRGAVLDLATRAPEGFSWLPKSLQGVVANGVDLGIFGVLLLASVWAVAVACERWLFYRRVDVGQYPNTAALETDLTRHLTVIGTVAGNAPYVGLLGTVLGIMMTFHKMGTEKSAMDVHSIMIGLSTALKATAIGLMVAIPCVVLNNVLRRRIRELVTAYEVRHGS